MGDVKPVIDADPPTSINLYGHSAVGAIGNHNTVFMTVERRKVRWPVVPARAPSRASAYQNRDTIQRLPGSGTAVLTGASGCGKTQIAAGLFASSSADLKLWVDARSRESVTTAYATAARALDLADADSGTPFLAGSFLAWAAAGKRTWLIVLDDIGDGSHFETESEGSSGLIDALWPSETPRGLVVATTQSRVASLENAGRSRFDVGPFSEGEAVEYLTSRLQPAASRGDLPRGALSAVHNLAALLGWHPLALSQAAALILNDAITTETYQRLLTEHGLASALPPSARADEYPATLPSAWMLAMERASARDPYTWKLLLLLSQLDPAGIPEQVAISPRVCAYLDPSASGVAEAQVREAIRVLNELCLIDYRPGLEPRTARVHALTGRLTREAATPEEQAAALKSAADSLADAWPGVGADLQITLLANASTIVELDDHDALLTAESRVHPILFLYGDGVAKTGANPKAVEYFERLASRLSQALGPFHRDTFRARHQAIYWRWDGGGDTACRPLFAQLLADMEQAGLRDEPETLTTRMELLQIEANTAVRSPDDTVAALTALYHDFRRVMEPESTPLLNIRESLADWKGNIGQVATAVDELEALLAERIAISGPDDETVFKTRHEIIYWMSYFGSLLGPQAVAENTCERERALLQDVEQALGAKSRLALVIRGSLGDYLADAGRYDEAISILEPLIVDVARVRGADHVETLRSRFNLARVRGLGGDAHAAAEELATLEPEFVQTLGEDHHHTLRLRQDLANWLSKEGRFAESAEVLAKLEQSEVRLYGSRDGRVFATRRDIATLTGQSGHAAQAEALLHQLLADAEAEPGANGDWIRNTREELNRWHRQAHRRSRLIIGWSGVVAIAAVLAAGWWLWDILA